MNSFSIFLPWTTPGPLGIVMGTGFAFWSFVLAILLIVVDVIIYYPFLKVYDEQVLEEELGNKEANNELKEKYLQTLIRKSRCYLGNCRASEAATDDTSSVDETTLQLQLILLVNKQMF